MNEQERFTRYWTQAQPVVARYIGALVPDFRDAEDLLQEVAITCLRKFAAYDERRPFVAWGLGIARVEALRLRRTQARSRVIFRPELLEQIAAACEELAPELDRRGLALRECLKQLQGRAGELVRLRYEEAQKLASIAQRVSMTVVAVRVMLSRTRTVLRRCIERRVKAEELQS